MVDREKFAELLYGTVINSASSEESAFEKLTRIREWIFDNAPKSLFRFRQYNDNSINALKNDQIWGSNIWQFNDPYECVPCYNLNLFWEKISQSLKSKNILSIINSLKNGEIHPQIRKAYPSIDFEWMRKNIPDQISEDDINEKIDIFAKYLLTFIGMDFNEIMQRFYLSIQQEEARWTIACFSEQNDSTLMWGHYADSHKGFCLEYDFQSILNNCDKTCVDIRGCNKLMLNLPLAPIIYRKNRFDATAFFSTVIQASLQEANKIPMDLFYDDTLIVLKCLLTKSIDWAYEKEWRLFLSPTNGSYESHKSIFCRLRVLAQSAALLYNLACQGQST